MTFDLYFTKDEVAGFNIPGHESIKEFMKGCL